MANLTNTSILSNGHLKDNETKVIETLFSIEVFVHSLNEVIGLEYLDCINPAIGFRLLDYSLEYIEQHPDYRQQYLNYRKSIQDNECFRNDVYLNYITFGRGKSCLFAINPEKLSHILEDPRSHILELYLVDLHHIQQVSSVNTSNQINSIKKCRVIGSVDKIRIHAADIEIPQQCDVAVKDIQDGSSLGRLRLTFKLHCVGLSKLQKEISSPSTVKQPPMETVSNPNLNSNLLPHNLHATVTAPNDHSPKPSKPPTKTTAARDMDLRTHNLRNHHCEVCLPEEMRKDLYDDGKQFWDQLFSQILWGTDSPLHKTQHSPSKHLKPPSSKTKGPSIPSTTRQQASKKNPSAVLKQSPVGIMKKDTKEEGKSPTRVPLSPRSIRIAEPQEESSLEPSAVFYHNPPDTKPPQAPVLFIQELPKPVQSNRVEPVEFANSRTLQATNRGSVLEALLLELLPILQAKNSSLFQKSGSPGNSTRIVTTDRSTSLEQESVEKNQDAVEKSVLEIKVQSRPTNTTQQSSYQGLNSSSVMIQTSPLESLRSSLEPVPSNSTSVVVMEATKMKNKRIELEDGTTQTEKFASPRNHKTTSTRLLENEIRKKLNLKKDNTITSSRTTNRSKEPSKKKQNRTSKRKANARPSLSSKEVRLFGRRSHQVVTPYNTSPRQLELLAKVHAIQDNIHAAKRKEHMKRLEHDEDKQTQLSQMAPKSVHNRSSNESSKEERKINEIECPSETKETKPDEVRPEQLIVTAHKLVVESKNSSFEKEYEETFEEPDSEVSQTHDSHSSTSTSSSEAQSSSEEESETEQEDQIEEEIDEVIQETDVEEEQDVQEEIIVSDDEDYLHKEEEFYSE